MTCRGSRSRRATSSSSATGTRGRWRPLEHNRLDLVSLALVLARALTLITGGPSAARDAYECLGLARLYDRAGRPDDADVAHEAAIGRLGRIGRDADTCADALRRLAWCRRRAGRLADAADARSASVACRDVRVRSGGGRRGPAIHHEHRVRDLDVARAHAEALIADESGGRWREAAEHRLRRIERKLESRRTQSAMLWPEG
ncbi:MAG: hypothetical protein R2712_28880 [Vicinamibacterales bacterium]